MKRAWFGISNDVIKGIFFVLAKVLMNFIFLEYIGPIIRWDDWKTESEIIDLILLVSYSESYMLRLIL